MTTPPPISVLLAEDHAIVRQGLRALLLADRAFTVAGEARTGREAVEQAQTLRPDVILMDIAMPVLNGLEATRQILTANPAARVIILSAHSDDEYVERMRAAGVAGFLEKQTSAEILTKAISEVATGRAYFSPSIIRRQQCGAAKSRDRNGLVKTDGQRLTPREAE
ncbi:MAG TPA: response regulator transcription factor, partial [Lacunisphaera sp.]|nr:response regulator transcription factor [Lacunisphaera sp.]